MHGCTVRLTPVQVVWQWCSTPVLKYREPLTITSYVVYSTHTHDEATFIGYITYDDFSILAL